MSLEDSKCLDKLLALLSDLKKVSQSEKYHPEVNAFNHSLQVFELAYHNTNDPDLIIAALFHDIGKAVSSHNHAEISADMLSECSFISKKTIWLVLNHLRIAYLLNGEMKKQEKINNLRKHEYYEQLVQLREFDTRGRQADYQSNIQEDQLKEILLSITNIT